MKAVAIRDMDPVSIEASGETPLSEVLLYNVQFTSGEIAVVVSALGLAMQFPTAAEADFRETLYRLSVAVKGAHKHYQQAPAGSRDHAGRQLRAEELFTVQSPEGEG